MPLPLSVSPQDGTAKAARLPQSSILRTTVVPAALLLFTPPFVGLVWYTQSRLDGSVARLADWIGSEGIVSVLGQIWGPIGLGSSHAWGAIAIFAVIELALMRLLPGKLSEGSTTPAGNVPVYKANGVAAFVTTVVLFLCGSFWLGLFPPTIIYDHFGELIGALNLAGIVLCVGLYLKGRFAPSSSDHGLSGNLIFDFYWGTELNSRLLGWDVKMFTNCRFGMMGWALILLSFAAKQYENDGFLSDAMAVAVALQLFYIAKFFWWEIGYLRSLDIAHDRAGFYICWGCLVWLPSIYTSSTLYLVGHPHHLGASLAATLLFVGLGAVLINYLADAQRQEVRRTAGEVKVWGKAPVLIRAHYKTSHGETKTNILLASGWWGLARHFHYFPELVGAFCWTAPALFDDALPYFYPVFLAILLVHRAWRDDERCATKYGADWEAYRARVPYRIIPGVI
jgi:7-dehydrocholesterol reductase